MKKKRITVETCEFCDEWRFLIKCSMCGKKACGLPHNRHITSFMSYWEVLGDKNSNDWYYAHDHKPVWLCIECQQKPFIEVWEFAQRLGWIAR